jgi:hypothetical protein
MQAPFFVEKAKNCEQNMTIFDPFPEIMKGL